MRILQAILGMVAIIVVAAQTYRHIYVRWIEPRVSVLERFQDQTEQDITKSKTIDELAVLYGEAQKKVKEEDQKHGDDTDTQQYYLRRQKDPYRSEEQIKRAIEEWESHNQQIYELQFFWWCGFASGLVGLIAYFKFSKSFGLSWLALGYLEMTWATSPSFRSFGSAIEFDRLLTYKVIYSVITLALVVLVWILIARNEFGGRDKSQSTIP